MTLPSRTLVFLAQTSLSDLQSKLGSSLKLIMSVGFLFGVILIMKGAADIRRGDDGKGEIVGGILIAAAPAIMYALYEIFLGGNIAPKF